MVHIIFFMTLSFQSRFTTAYYLSHSSIYIQLSWCLIIIFYEYLSLINLNANLYKSNIRKIIWLNVNLLKIFWIKRVPTLNGMRQFSNASKNVKIIIQCPSGAARRIHSHIMRRIFVVSINCLSCVYCGKKKINNTMFAQWRFDLDNLYFSFFFNVNNITSISY